MQQRVREVLTGFPWHNYGLDMVSDPDTSTEWADALAAEITATVKEL